MRDEFFPKIKAVGNYDKATYLGYPITDFNKDELIRIIAWLSAELQKAWNETVKTAEFYDDVLKGEKGY